MKSLSILFLSLLSVVSHAESVQEAYEKGLKTEADLKLMTQAANALTEFHWVEDNCFHQDSDFGKLKAKADKSLESLLPKLDRTTFSSVDEVDAYFTGLQPEWYNTRAQVWTFLQEIRKCLGYSKKANKFISRNSGRQLIAGSEEYVINPGIAESSARMTTYLVKIEKSVLSHHRFLFSEYLKAKAKEFRSDLISKQKDASFKDLVGTVLTFETLMQHLDKIYAHIESIRTLKMNIEYVWGRNHRWILGPKSDDLLRLVSDASAYYNGLPDRLKPTQPAQRLKVLIDATPQAVDGYKKASTALTLEKSHKLSDHLVKQLLKGLKIRLIDSGRLDSLRRSLDKETDLASRLAIMFDIEVEARTLQLQIQ